ncbi:IS3 family transposase [Flavobacterium sp. SH_e]|uniref:IS3 family transposase n=1 Tax=Flavobacterium TaxID=237 RepID=UPI0021E4C998|nr:IS3 family transposase [Flavobacterium sp. SH_e]MCV2485084.1 IS3 family transposase [Flavobacterium sp. SH_e]
MKQSKKSYNNDFKLKIVKLSFEKRKQEDLAKEFNITSNSIINWRKNFIINGEENFSLLGKTKLTEQEKKIYALKTEIKKTDIKFDIINGAIDYLNKGLPATYQYIKENEKKYSSYLMCSTLGISLDSYKKWKNNYISERKKWKIKLKEEITSIFINSKMRYGSMRIAVELQKSGNKVSADTVLNCMRELNLYALEKNNKPDRANL